MPEISEPELQILASAKKAMDNLLSNKKTRRDAQKLIATANPDLDIKTDDELIEPALSEVSELRKEIKEFLSSQKDREVDTTLNSEFDSLRGEGFSDEGIEAVKKIMLERSIKSPVDAAAVWHKRNPPKPQEPAGFQPSTWFNDKDEDIKNMFKDEDAWADDMAKRVWAEETAKNNQIKY